MPHELTSSYESALLSLCLSDPASRARAAILPPKAFADTRHQAILVAMRQVEKAGDVVDAVTVGTHMRDTGVLSAAGGIEYIADVAGDHGADPRRTAFLVEQVTARWTRREMAQHLHAAVDTLGQAGSHVDDAVAQVRAALDRAMATACPFERLGAMAADLETLFRLGPSVPSLRTGLPDLDHVLGGGLAPTRLYMVAAPTGAGKSSLALLIAHEAAKASRKDPRLGAGVIYISLELTREETAIRLISQAQPITHGYRRSSGWDPADLPLAMKGLGQISELPLYCLEPSSATMDSIRSQVDAFSTLVGRPALVVVDYIGLVSTPGARSTLEAVTEVTRALKRMALSLKIPVLALAQLNRESLRRDDHRPKLSDLRDSGSIEQDSDVILFLHSDHFFLDPARQAQHIGPVDVEIVVAKNRMGSRGSAAVRWIQHRYLYLPAGCDAGTLAAGAPAGPSACPGPQAAPGLAARVLEAVGELERATGRPARRPEILEKVGIDRRAKWQDTPCCTVISRLLADGRLAECRDGAGKLAAYTYAIPSGAPVRDGATPTLVPTAGGSGAQELEPELDDDRIRQLFG